MDPRYKFIRGQPFDGLKDYFEAPILEVKDININFPVQTSMFTGFNQSNGLNKKLGDIFELISRGIHGGRIKQRQELDYSENTIIIEPDITCENYYFEVKSVAPGEALKLKDSQIAKYFLLETGDYSKKKPIKFDIFRHGIKKLQSNFRNKSLDELILNIANSTKFMVSAPFRVVFDLYSSDQLSRDDGDKHPTSTKVNSTNLNKLITYPKETLESLKVELEGLEFRKNKFPEGVKLNGYEISSFPILTIEDSGSEKWNKKFIEFLKARENILPYFFNLEVDMLVKNNQENFGEDDIPF